MYTLEEKDDIGRAIAEMLMLRKNKIGRYKTTWGDKTAVGIFETINRLGEHIKEDSILEALR